MTPYSALLERARTEPARPLVTYLNVSTGERMELSATTLLNVVAKTAGLLRDELEIEHGDRVRVLLPLHWQRAIWWGACAFVGGIYGTDTEADLIVTDRSGLATSQGARDVALVSLAPFGLPDGQPVPSGVIDAAVASRSHPDSFVPYDVPQEDWPLMEDQAGAVTAGQTMQIAANIAQHRGLPEGTRFAVRPGDPQSHLLQLAVPLAMNGSVLLLDGSADTDLVDALASESAILTEEAP